MIESNLASLDSEIQETGPDWVLGLVNRERSRRAAEYVPDSCADFERRYFGIEVGNQRRYFESILRPHIRPGKILLDYGCGGTWWKDYWRIPSHVTGVDVVPPNLESPTAAFPDHARVRLISAPTGLTTLADSSFAEMPY